jgi:hypothetical protein
LIFFLTPTVETVGHFETVSHFETVGYVETIGHLEILGCFNPRLSLSTIIHEIIGKYFARMHFNSPRFQPWAIEIAG